VNVSLSPFLIFVNSAVMTVS